LSQIPLPDQPISLVFFGTPGYAVSPLRALGTNPRFEVRAVVTQPDRPAGRGHALVSSPVKAIALDLGLPVLQPQTLRDEDIRDHFRALDVDLFVVAAYGLIFGAPVLSIPRLGCINLHASILPHYRGAAPVNAAILNGDAETGVTLMLMERGLDTGPVLATAVMSIKPNHTTESLTIELGEMGANLATMGLPAWCAGSIQPVKQSGPATAVRQLTKSDGQIDWRRPAVEIERHVRAMWNWPRAWTSAPGTSLQIHGARVDRSSDAQLEPGKVDISSGDLRIGTGIGWLVVDRGLLAGGKPLPGPEIVRGSKLGPDTKFDSPVPPDIPLIRTVIET
jgi:methionyl-tRNA formyltransferase